MQGVPSECRVVQLVHKLGLSSSVAADGSAVTHG